MKQHGTLFNQAMSASLLADLKTQTRRALKRQPVAPRSIYDHPEADTVIEPRLLQCGTGLAVGWRFAMTKLGNIPAVYEDFEPARLVCPYGQPGDQIYVKETFYAWGTWEKRYSAKKRRDEWHFVDMTLESGVPYRFQAPGDFKQAKKRRAGALPTWHRRPAIFMPKVAARTWLLITAVRVERLQAISEADALAEGIQALIDAGVDHDGTPRDTYRVLWDTINGPGDWQANPHVWVLTFKRLFSDTKVTT